MALQQGVCDDVCGVAGGVQKLFVGVPEVVGNRSCLIVGHAKRGDSARPRLSLAQFANLVRRRGNARADANSQCFSMSDTPRSVTLALSGAVIPRDYSG